MKNWTSQIDKHTGLRVYNLDNYEVKRSRNKNRKWVGVEVVNGLGQNQRYFDTLSEAKNYYYILSVLI